MVGHFVTTVLQSNFIDRLVVVGVQTAAGLLQDKNEDKQSKRKINNDQRRRVNIQIELSVSVVSPFELSELCHRQSSKSLKT
jgi:hypothetical protein